MGSNDIIKPLSTDLSRAVIESLQHRIILISEKFRERGESNPGRWVWSENAIHCATRPPIRAKGLFLLFGLSHDFTLLLTS